MLWKVYQWKMANEKWLMKMVDENIGRNMADEKIVDIWLTLADEKY